MIDVSIVAPEQVIYQGQAHMVVLPGAEGDLGILEKHAPLVSLLRPGVVHIHTKAQGEKDQKVAVFVSGGFVNMADDQCAVLADEAVPLADVTPAMIEERLAAASTALEVADTLEERAQAEHALAIAHALEKAVKSA